MAPILDIDREELRIDSFLPQIYFRVSNSFLKFHHKNSNRTKHKPPSDDPSPPY
jgi:hypothetical protein